MLTKETWEFWFGEEKRKKERKKHFAQYFQTLKNCIKHGMELATSYLILNYYDLGKVRTVEYTVHTKYMLYIY